MLAKGMEKFFTLYHQALKHQKKASVYEYFIFKDAKMLSIFAKAVWKFTKNCIFFLLFDQY